MFRTIFHSHKYKTKHDLARLNAEDIIKLDPKDVKSDIVENTKGVDPLSKIQNDALKSLLSIKRVTKGKDASYSQGLRNTTIDSFLKKQKPDMEVEKLIAKAQSELDAADKEKMKKQMQDEIKDVDISNRLASIRNQDITPYTEEQKQFLKSQGKLGGKRHCKTSKRSLGKTVTKRRKSRHRKKTKKGYKISRKPSRKTKRKQKETRRNRLY